MDNKLKYERLKSDYANEAGEMIRAFAMNRDCIKSGEVAEVCSELREMLYQAYLDGYHAKENEVTLAMRKALKDLADEYSPMTVVCPVQPTGTVRTNLSHEEKLQYHREEETYEPMTIDEVAKAEAREL